MQEVSSHDVGYAQLNISFSVVVGIVSVLLLQVNDPQCSFTLCIPGRSRTDAISP